MEASEREPKTESCVKYVDALWFCYSPVHQVKEYYREGEFDSCLGKLSDLWTCLLLRTSAAPRIRESMERKRVEECASIGMWQLRTVQEAEKWWKEEFTQEQGTT
eukprot:TRINITY_DN970_c0_g1_i2.p1 TRINITY_DN970_c0_g1~~TRINITY_DN970_c0_g1_i2.p1  ORF type:complete len:105 (-),score=18.47 TRINITY_DN970_c0_g1_i2:86-400(-)